MATIAQHVWRPSGARRVVLDGFVPIPRGTIPSAPAPLVWPAKDPEDVLDYEFDVAAALQGNRGDSIATIDVVISPNATGDLVLNSTGADGTIAVMWFGAGLAGTIYSVHITVGTNDGRTINRVVLLPVQALANVSVVSSALTNEAGAIITDQIGNPILIGS